MSMGPVSTLKCITMGVGGRRGEGYPISPAYCNFSLFIHFVCFNNTVMSPRETCGMAVNSVIHD